MATEERINFELINIHKTPISEEDHSHTPWIVSSRIEENHGHPIFSCSFNPYSPDGKFSYLVTVSDRFVHIYECSLSTNGIGLLGAYHCTSATESFYASSWCYDSYEMSIGNDPYFLALGGNNGIIYVVDAIKQSLVNRLTSHGGAINEIRTCPSNPSIIASASKDKTVRVFHIRNDACLIVCGGHDSHADQILSLDWSLCGSKIISCGMDHTILMWDMMAKKQKSTINRACELLQKGKRNTLIVSNDDVILRAHKSIDATRNPPSSDRKRRSNGSKPEKPMETIRDTLDDICGQVDDEVYVPLYFPMARNCDLHTDYVDCVRFFGNSDYVFSKGCGKESVIYMFRFGSIGKTNNNSTTTKIFETETSSIKLMQKDVPNGETWFIKFDLDPLNKWLACGDNSGNVHFWKLADFRGRNPTYSINIGNRVVRQVAFGGGGRILIAVSDDGSIIRLDRIHSGVKNVPSFKITIGPNAGMMRQTKKVYKKKQEEEQSGKEDDETEQIDPIEKMRMKTRSDMSVNCSDFED